MIDLSFLSNGKDSSISLAQLQSMDKELEAISKRAPDIIALGKAFGLTYDSAEKLVDQLQLQPPALSAAVAAMQELKSVGADNVTQYAVLSKQLGLSADQMQLLSGEVKALGAQETVVNDLTEAFSQLFLLDKVNQFRAAVLGTGQVFETLNARLKTTLGTQEAANAALDRIQRFASTTPFELVEVTDSFINLKQRGIDPTNEALTNLGDIASSQGKSLDQATEALLDASQGQFERLVEFGIRASAAGDKVNLSFQGVNKQVARTPEGITAGILSLGKLDGVAGGMAEASKTLGGSLSNLKDNQDKLSAATFAYIQGPAVAFVSSANKLIDSFFKLNPAMQQAILVTGLLGATVVSATVALAAFQAANVAVALSTAASTLAKTPAAIATAALAAATKLAALAEVDLLSKQSLGTAATVAKTIAVTGLTSATKLLAAATSPAALAAGLLAGAAAGVAVALAAVVTTYQSVTQSTREVAEVTEQLEKNYRAIDAATEKRLKTAAAAADADSKAAIAAERNALTIEQLAQRNAQAEAAFSREYAKSVSDRMTWVDKFLDKVRQFVDVPRSLTQLTFELVAKLPLPSVFSDFFAGVAKQFDATKQRLAADSLIDNDAIASARLLDQVDSLSAKLQELRSTATDGALANASLAEVETLALNYETLLAQLEQQVPANAAAATARDQAVRSLKAEQDEVLRSKKLIEERAKRISEAGTAEVQFAAEIAKTSANMTKQIATTDEASRALELTRQQLDNGFIDTATAERQFAQVAKYTQATGEVQVAAAQELDAVRQQQADNQIAQLDTLAAQEELAGARQIRAAEDVAAAVADIAVRRQQVEVERLQKTLASREAEGRQATDIQQQLAQAQAALDTAKAQATDAAIAADSAAAQRQADTVNAELDTLTLAEELKGAMRVQTAEETEAAVAAIGVRRQQAEIERLQTVMAAEKAAGRETGENYKRLAEQLEQATLSLSKSQLEAVQASQRAAQAAIDDTLRKANESRADRAAEITLAAKQAELSAVQSGNLSIAEAERQFAEEQSIAERDELAGRIEATRAAKQQLAAVEGKEARDRAEQLGRELLQLQQQQLDAELAAIREAQQRKIEAIREAQQRQNDAEAAAVSIDAANAEQELAELRLANAGAVGERQIAIDRQISAERRRLAVAAAEAELSAAERNQVAVQQLIEAGAIEQQDAATRRLEADAQLVAAQSELYNAAADAEAGRIEQLRQAKLDAIDDEAQARQLVANEAVGQLQLEQQLLQERSQLMSAEQQLLSARQAAAQLSNDLAMQDLEIAKEAAEARGESSRAERLGRQIRELELDTLRAQAVEIQAQYDFKLRSLELDIRSKELAAEQLVIQQRMAELAAQQAVRRAELQGASKEELALVRQQAQLATQSRQLAERSQATTGSVSAAQRQALTLERATALNANRGQIERQEAADRNAETASRFSTRVTGASEAASTLSTTLGEATSGVRAFNEALAKSVQRTGSTPATLISGARADGGSVLAGHSYLIGERGPEVVTFGQSGNVLSNEAVMAALAAKLQPAASSTGQTEVLRELTALRELVASRQLPAMSVPITVYESDNSAAAAAAALQLMRASRAKAYSGLS